MSLNSEIILVSGMKIDKQYTNVLSYSESQMLALCRQKQVASGNKYSFLRPTNSLYVDFTYSQCLQANYIAFQNTDYSNKWFFAWIDEVIYKGEKNCEIRYTVDAWSTWFDYWAKKPCYILREHVNNDSIGANTIPENLSVEEVVQEYEQEDIALSQYFFVGVLTSHNPATNSNFPTPYTIVKKNIMAKKLCLFENVESSTDLGLFLLQTNQNGHADDIDSVFFIPSALIDRSKLEQNSGAIGQYSYNFYTIQNTTDIQTINFSVPKQYNFSDYTPKNNKCFVYPYNYLFVSNNIGNQNIYKYENFSTQNANFDLELTVSVGCSGRLVPKNSQGKTKDDDEILPLGKYPTIAWSSDSYTNWLTQQAINIPTKIATSFIPSVSANKEGGATVDATGVALNVAGQVAGLIGEFYSASLLPNVTHGQNTADINFLAERNTFTFRCMRAKTEYMKIIDDYFSRFGYAINRVLEPNIVGRTTWNYLQIGVSECIGYGTAPANFMETINNACRRGVTIWHNHDNIGNYNLNNGIVTNNKKSS